MDENTVLVNNSIELQALFDFNWDEYSDLQQRIKEWMSAIQIKTFLEKIRSLKENVQLKRGTLYEEEQITPWTVYVYDVCVVCEHDGLRIYEKGPSKQKDFFSKDQLFKAARVIWIHSKGVRVIDAKLRVYEKFQALMNDVEDKILIHHHFEEDDEIFKFCCVYILDSLDGIISSIKSNISLEDLNTILQDVAEKTWTQENIRKLSWEVHTGYLKPCGSASHCCWFHPDLVAHKELLLKNIFDEVLRLLVSCACHKVSNILERRLGMILKEFFPKLNLDISPEVCLKERDVNSITSKKYTFWNITILSLLRTIKDATFTFLWPPDINSFHWRNEVADEFHAALCSNKSSILSECYDDLDRAIQDRLKQIRRDLQTVEEHIDKFKGRINLPYQRNSIKEWKEREVIKMKLPSLLTYIAGKKSCLPVVKVFLSHEDESDKKTISKICGERKGQNFEIIYVIASHQFKQKSENTGNRMELEETASSRDIEMMQKLHRIIQRQSEKLMARHSTVIAIGVDRNQHGFPTIVLYCLDKMIIPFGEKKLPEYLEDEKVEIRDI